MNSIFLTLFSIAGQLFLSLAMAWGQDREIAPLDSPDNFQPPSLHTSFPSLLNQTMDLWKMERKAQKVPGMTAFFLKRFKEKAPEMFSFLDPYTLEEITTKEEFLEYLQSRKLIKGKDPTAAIEALRDVMAEIETYKKHLPTTEMEKLAFDPQAFNVMVKPIDYGKLLQSLEDDPHHKMLKRLYHLMVEDEERLRSISYPDDEDIKFNQNCNMKKMDLANFFNELTEDFSFIASSPGFSAFWEAFSATAPQFKDELLFKMKLIADLAVKEKLTSEEMAFLIQHLLHAGRHCPDAKGHVVVENLFPMLCPLEQKKMEESLVAENDYFTKAFILTTKFKRDVLDKYIRSLIKDDQREAISVRAATWDKWAPLLGLEKLGSPYSHLAVSTGNIRDIISQLTVKRLIQAYEKENLPRFQKTLGPLLDFAQPEFYRFMAMAELQRTGILSAIPEKEQELLAAHPLLATRRLLNPDQYSTTQLIYALLKGDQDWVKSLWREGRVKDWAQVVAFTDSYDPFDLKDSSKFPLLELVAAFVPPEKGILREFARFVKANPVPEKTGLSPLARVLKTGNQEMANAFLKEGLVLTEFDRQWLTNRPNHSALIMIKNFLNAGILSREPWTQLTERMEQKIASGYKQEQLEKKFDLYHKSKFFWRKTINLNWSDIVRNDHGMIQKMTYRDAEIYCRERGGRLPKKRELQALAKFLGQRSGEQYNPQLIKDFDFKEAEVWVETSVSSVNSMELARGFNGSTGKFLLNKKGSPIQVICVWEGNIIGPDKL